MSKQIRSKPSKKSAITELKNLLAHGEADKTKLSALSYGSEIELFRTSEDGQRYVAHNLLLNLLSDIPSQKDVLTTALEYIEKPSEIPDYAQEDIAKFKKSHSNLSVPDISYTCRVKNWCEGRLLLSPGLKSLNNPEVQNPSSVLSGSWDYPLFTTSSSSSLTPENAMTWVLSSPWAFFLAQVVFTKEIWDAKRTNSCFHLELSSKDGNEFDRPSKVDVIVDLDNQLINCGSLGELILRTLKSIDIKLFPKPLTAEELNTKLKPLITLLIKHNVWSFYRNRYEIHQSFSSSCFKAIGINAFNHAGIPLSGTIQDTLLRWATEYLSRVSIKRSSYRL